MHSMTWRDSICGGKYAALRKINGVFIAMVALLPAALAQVQVVIGQRLDAARIQKLGPLESVDIDGQKYLLLETHDVKPGFAMTLLVNPEGVVGETTHQLVITQQPAAAVRQYLDAQAGVVTEATYYDHMEITLLGFATLQQAVEGMARIRKTFPQAKVQFPIRYANENQR